MLFDLCEARRQLGWHGKAFGQAYSPADRWPQRLFTPITI